MKQLSAGKLIVKNSIFFGHFYSIDKKDDVKMIVKSHKTLYKKANHHCYAIVFMEKSGQIYKSFKNDSEVGHPGKILLDILNKYDFQSNVLIVSRVFGGIKLGIGGVSRSFKDIGDSIVQYYIFKNIHN